MNLVFTFQVWTFVHLPSLQRGELTREGLVPLARRWTARHDSHSLSDQIAQIQDALDSLPFTQVLLQFKNFP
jgi:hypothetical protein